MLIKNKEQFKLLLGGAVNKHLSWESVGNFIGQAEQKYIIPVIGNELYQVLDTADPEALTPKQKVVFGLLGQSLAFYGLLEAIPFLSLQISDAGINEVQLGNYAPARQWAVNKAEETAADNGDLFLDQALSFLELNADDFAEWKDSEAFTINKDLLISSTAELNKQINIQNSRRTFLAFLPFLKRAQDIFIIPELGVELADQLFTARKTTDPLSPDLKKLLSLVQPVLSHYTMLEAIPELAIRISAGGFKVLNSNDGIRQRFAASDKNLVPLRSNSERLATIYMTSLKNYLDSIIQEGESAPEDKQQSFTAPDNSGSTSFWA